MAYGLIVKNVLIQKQSKEADGFVEIPDNAVCGQVWDGKGFHDPEPAPQDYKTLRAKAYPPIGDQLDALMKWLSTETEISIPAELKSIAMSCMSVKAKYPKTGDGA